jgi:hypothetical protein
MQQMLDTMGLAQTVLQQGGSRLSQTRTNVLDTVSALSGQGWQIAPDGAVSVRHGSPIDQYARLSPVNAMKIQQLAATNSAIVKMQLAAFDTTDRALSQNLRAAVAGLDGAPEGFGVVGAPLPEAPPYDTGAEIPRGKEPKEVHQWWESR